MRITIKTSLIPGLTLAAFALAAACTSGGGGICGDGVAQKKEDCDLLDYKGATCETLGFIGGTLACSDCTVDTTGCHNCGDGVIDATEQCEPGDLAGQTCQGEGFTGGTLACSANCQLDTSGCTSTFCGDGNADSNEECDMDDLKTGTCADEGFDIGTLACNPDCTYNTAQCANNLSLCMNQGPRTTADATGTLTCGDSNPSGNFEWDIFVIPVQAGDCVDIFVDNMGTGEADLLAIALDANGDGYGLAADFSQLDDEVACSVPPWDGFDCPAASVTVESTGDFTILVSQWFGGGTTPGTDACYADAEYQLYLAVNGAPVTPTQTEDNVP